MRVALLIGTLTELDTCHALYANALTAAGHEVWCGSVNSLSSHDAEVRTSACRVESVLKAHAPVPGRLVPQGLADMDAVWVLNYPQPSVQTEAWQLLWRLNRQVPFVNDVTGILMLGNKTNLPVIVDPQHLPHTVITSNYEELSTICGTDADATWLVKPTDDDAGADVYVLEPGSTNNQVLLQSMTGNAAVTELLTKGSLAGFRGRYCALQEFVPHAEEKRVIIAAGRPVAQQAHHLAPGEHRGNTAHRARCAETELTADEHELCTRIGARLREHGIRFAGIDLAYPYVFEFNVVNPGGLDERIDVLGLDDITGDVAEALLADTVASRSAARP
ncbi:ATP-grasp domain-containing protein [Streptomyces sp. NPDC054871]